MIALNGVRCGLLGISVAVCFAASGCQTISPSLDGLLSVVDLAASDSEQVPEVVAGPSFVVEYRRDGAPPAAKKMPWQEGMCVQDGLDASGATRLKRMKVCIMRALPQGGRHRMGIEIERSTKRVKNEFNYALRPDDHIVVEKDDSTALDDTLGAIFGPMGINFRRE
jgi:hypothetical protein